MYGIVKQSGGYVSIYSQVGTGTTVKVYLPHTEGAVDKGAPKTEASAVSIASATILVAEDEDAVRKLVGRILESNGFRVLSAPDSQEALRIASAHEGTIDVLVAVHGPPA